MVPPSQPARRNVRNGLAILLVLVLASIGLLVLRGDGDGGRPGRPDVSDVPVREGLDGTDVIVYGDSWSVPGGWHSAGRHWSQLLLSRTDVGQVLSFGIGGRTMEHVANLVTGSGRGGWMVTPQEPVVTIVMSVLNSSHLPTADVATRDRSLESMRQAALTAGARILSDEYPEDDPHSERDGAWTAVQGEAFAGGSVQRSSAGTVTFTVPEGIDGRMLWMSTLAGAESVTYEVTREGDEPEQVDTPVSESPEETGFTKWFLPIGKVDGGEQVSVRNVTGEFFYDGMYLDSGKGIVAFATEPTEFDSSFHPQFNDAEPFEVHDEELRATVEELNELVPGGAELIDLDAAPGWNPTTMLFRDDEIHPDDTGQAWIFDIVAPRLREIIQESTRFDP